MPGNSRGGDSKRPKAADSGARPVVPSGRKMVEDVWGRIEGADEGPTLCFLTKGELKKQLSIPRGGESSLERNGSHPSTRPQKKERGRKAASKGGAKREAMDGPTGDDKEPSGAVKAVTDVPSRDNDGSVSTQKPQADAPSHPLPEIPRDSRPGQAGSWPKAQGRPDSSVLKKSTGEAAKTATGPEVGYYGTCRLSWDKLKVDFRMSKKDYLLLRDATDFVQVRYQQIIFCASGVCGIITSKELNCPRTSWNEDFLRATSFLKHDLLSTRMTADPLENFELVAFELFLAYVTWWIQDNYKKTSADVIRLCRNHAKASLSTMLQVYNDCQRQIDRVSDFLEAMEDIQATKFDLAELSFKNQVKFKEQQGLAGPIPAAGRSRTRSRIGEDQNSGGGQLTRTNSALFPMLKSNISRSAKNQSNSVGRGTLISSRPWSLEVDARGVPYPGRGVASPGSTPGPDLPDTNSLQKFASRLGDAPHGHDVRPSSAKGLGGGQAFKPEGDQITHREDVDFDGLPVSLDKLSEMLDAYLLRCQAILVKSRELMENLLHYTQGFELSLSRNRNTTLQAGILAKILSIAANMSSIPAALLGMNLANPFAPKSAAEAEAGLLDKFAAQGAVSSLNQPSRSSTLAFPAQLQGMEMFYATILSTVVIYVLSVAFLCLSWDNYSDIRDLESERGKPGKKHLSQRWKSFLTRFRRHRLVHQRIHPFSSALK